MISENDTSIQFMIEIDSLSKSYGTLKAVDRLNIRVPKGELYCFVGPNGAGKTTTIKMLTGLVRPDDGTIRIGGIDIQEDPVAAKQLMGYIPDMPYLYERLTPVEFLRFVGDVYGVAPDRMSAAMEDGFALFGLNACRNVLVGDLSHGMRQRLVYVATFLHEPRVICIDEPLVGLDPYTIRLIKDLLRRKTREGMTIFLTTHILTVAEEIADRIGILAGGRLVAQGSMAQLKEEAGREASLEDMFLKLTAEEH